MSLIPLSHIIAAKIEEANSQTIGFLRSQATNTFALANTQGQQQAIMDAFGANAVSALTTYSTIYGALVALGKADGLAAPDLNIFQPQPDGTLIYVAPEPPAEP